MKNLSITHNSTTFSFSDVDSTTILRKFEGFDYPETIPVVEDIAGEGGALYITSKFGRRMITIVGDLIGSSVFTNRRTLGSVLRQNGTLKLFKFTTYDNLTLQCEAEITKYLNQYNHSVHTFMIEAVAPDWRLYSQTLESVDVDDEEEITNNGNEQSPPIIRLSGVGTCWTVENETTGKSFIIEKSITGENYIEIDVKERTVMLNNTSSVYGDFEGDFWSLEPGVNDIKLTVIGGDETSKANIKYRHAYNSI
jgi:hypothetical protein